MTTIASDPPKRGSREWHRENPSLRIGCNALSADFGPAVERELEWLTVRGYNVPRQLTPREVAIFIDPADPFPESLPVQRLLHTLAEWDVVPSPPDPGQLAAVNLYRRHAPAAYEHLGRTQIVVKFDRQTGESRP